MILTLYTALTCVTFTRAILCYNCTAVDIRSTTKVVIDKFDSFAKRLDKECHTPKGYWVKYTFCGNTMTVNCRDGFLSGESCGYFGGELKTIIQGKTVKAILHRRGCVTTENVKLWMNTCRRMAKLDNSGILKPVAEHLDMKNTEFSGKYCECYTRKCDGNCKGIAVYNACLSIPLILMTILCTVITVALVWHMCGEKSRKNRRIRLENEHRAMQQQIDYVERREKLIEQDLWPPAPDPVILEKGTDPMQGPIGNPYGKNGMVMNQGLPKPTKEQQKKR